MTMNEMGARAKTAARALANAGALKESALLHAAGALRQRGGGGGRCDGLVELEGGKPTAGVGFAVGFERALLALQAFGSDLGADEAPCVYVANAGKELRQNVFAITQELRAAGIVTEADYQGRSLKAQFKQADKVGAKLILVLGGDELAAGKVKVRDMQSHDEVLADLDNVVEAVRERL